MEFHIDKQTREELNVQGKFRTDSVYQLFNQVKSRGGVHLLDELFHRPLTNAAVINERSDSIRYFQEAGIDFPFDVQRLNDVREYIHGSTGKSSFLVFVKMLVKKGLSTLVHDDGLKKIVQGLQATIVTLHSCSAFLDRLPSTGTAYADRIHEMKNILANDTIRKLSETDIYQVLPLRKLAAYDFFLKAHFHEEMKVLLAHIYEADVFIAVSDVARINSFAYAHAEPAEANVFHADNLMHPAIKGAVGNTLSMDHQHNVLFLTGANMAGKSTLMKAVGIGLYLAHMGFPVAASRFTFSVREGLYTSINTADNISLGYSHFFAEVMRVKEAAEAVSSGKRLLLIFDELFKGTNVKDAYDGTLAVTEAFAEYRECLFIVSTHIIEVGEALKGAGHIRFSYLPTIMEGKYPRYTYQLTEGITEDRQGMMIINNEGILELIAGEDLLRNGGGHH